MEIVIIVSKKGYGLVETALKCANISYEFKSILCKDELEEFTDELIVADIPALANYFDLIDGLRDFTDIQSQPRPKNTPTQSSWGFDVVNKDDWKYYKMPHETPLFAKIDLVMLKNQYFAPTMWVHFSWRLQYKFITSHNQERVKFLLKHHRASLSIIKHQ